MRVTVNGCELNVEVTGPEDEPVLCRHEKSGHSPQTEERELFLSTVRDFLDSAVPVA